MSARVVERALARMRASGVVLMRGKAGDGFGVYPNGDRRRRPLVRLRAEEVRALEAEGAIVLEGEVYVLSGAGDARVLRSEAHPGEAFVAQHRPIIDRTVMDDSGARRSVRGHEAQAALRRLAALRDANGAPWLSDAELAAANRLRSDWEAGERGLIRGSDWTSPPNGSAARGGREGALTAHCDARRRVADALAGLAPALRRIVERVCLREQGLEALERVEAWPSRSGKLALKLALAQLASAY